MGFNPLSLGSAAAGTVGKVAGKAAFPWDTFVGGTIGAIGQGLTAAEELELQKKQQEQQQKEFDWKKHMDQKGQFNQERVLGQNTLQGMRGSFKDALYKALTRG